MSDTQPAKMAAALPKTAHGNGLNAIAPDLIAEPEKVRYAVIRFDCGKIETKFETDEDGERYEVVTPSARVKAFEPLDGTAAEAAARLMDAARGERLGELPYHAMGGSGA